MLDIVVAVYGVIDGVLGVVGGMCVIGLVLIVGFGLWWYGGWEEFWA